jgi:hypothetical protein
LDNVVGFVLHRTSFGSTHPTGKNLAVENPYFQRSDSLPEGIGVTRTETGEKSLMLVHKRPYMSILHLCYFTKNRLNKLSFTDIYALPTLS